MTGDDPKTLAWRLGEVEKDQASLWTRAAAIPVQANAISNIEKAQGEYKDEMRSLRQALVLFSLTVSGSAIAVLVGLLTVLK